jgi:hypothetical protein
MMTRRYKFQKHFLYSGQTNVTNSNHRTDDKIMKYFCFEQSAATAYCDKYVIQHKIVSSVAVGVSIVVGSFLRGL